jgi:rod shape-determining protein MreD
MSSSIYVALPAMILLAIAQTAILPRFPIFGVVPQLPFLIALARGLLRGPNEGALWAFVAGICLDLFSVGPIGATALAYMVAILAATWSARVLPPNRYLMPILLAGVATLLSLLLYLLLLLLLGRTSSSLEVETLIPLALMHGGLILPFYWLMFALERIIRPRRVEV